MAQKTYSVIRGHKVLFKSEDGNIYELRLSEKAKQKVKIEDLKNTGIAFKVVKIK